MTEGTIERSAVRPARIMRPKPLSALPEAKRRSPAVEKKEKASQGPTWRNGYLLVPVLGGTKVGGKVLGIGLGYRKSLSSMSRAERKNAFVKMFGPGKFTDLIDKYDRSPNGDVFGTYMAMAAVEGHHFAKGDAYAGHIVMGYGDGKVTAFTRDRGGSYDVGTFQINSLKRTVRDAKTGKLRRVTREEGVALARNRYKSLTENNGKTVLVNAGLLGIRDQFNVTSLHPGQACLGSKIGHDFSKPAQGVPNAANIEKYFAKIAASHGKGTQGAVRGTDRFISKALNMEEGLVLT